MASKLDTVESLMQCPICLGDFTDPRILPCLHTLCRECLEKHVSASTLDAKFSCPSCRHECQVPKEGLSAIPKNFFLNSIRGLLAGELAKTQGDTSSDQSMADSGYRLCDNARRDTVLHEEVTSFCANCAEFYCKTCASYHSKFGISHNHKLRPASEVDAKTVEAVLKQAKIPLCEQHPDLKLDLYCDCCEVSVCTKCCLLSHQQHKYRELATVAQGCQDKLAELSRKAAAHIVTLDKHIEGLQVSETKIQRDASKACQEVQQAADELRGLVTKREEYLTQQIKQKEEMAVLEVKAAFKETELNKANIQSLQSYMQTLQESGSFTDQVVHTPGLQEQLRQQQAAPLRTVLWTASLKKETSSVAVLDAILGTVGMDNYVVTTKPATGGGSDTDVVMNLGAPLSTLKPAVGNQLSGLVVFGDCVCATGWGKSKLWIHNTATNTSKVHTLQGLGALSMTVVSKDTDNTLVIGDINKKLHFVTFSFNTLDMSMHTVKDIMFVPLHISTHPVSGQLVIVEYINKAVVTSDKQGNIQNKIKLQPDVGVVWCTAATDDGYVILDKSDPGRVHWVDNRGKVTRTYGQNYGEGLRNPWQLVRGSQGQLVIADSDNRKLHLVDASGQLLCHLLIQDDGITRPLYVWLEEASSLLYVARVTSDSPAIDVYKCATAALESPLTGNATYTQHTLQVKLLRYN